MVRTFFDNSHLYSLILNWRKKYKQADKTSATTKLVIHEATSFFIIWGWVYLRVYMKYTSSRATKYIDLFLIHIGNKKYLLAYEPIWLINARYICSKTCFKRDFIAWNQKIKERENHSPE